MLSVNQVILAFWKHAETYYVKDGKPTTELANFRIALKNGFVASTAALQRASSARLR